MILRRIRYLIAAALLTLAGTLGAQTSAPEKNPFKDPLDSAALPNRIATRTQLNAVTRAGERLVAVGVRGLILLSDDAGATWKQAPAPVSTDLLALHFPTPKLGWVVGHNGVVLHSADGGETWHKQLDGRMTHKLLTSHFEARVKAGDPKAARFLEDVAFSYGNGPEQALLGVWFVDPRKGFVGGSFGTLLATEDGGNTWQSWIEKVPTAEAVHLNSLRGIGSDIFIASEKGNVFRLSSAAGEITAFPTGYAGSFFGVTGSPASLIAYGLRGNAFRSVDDGRSWTKLDTGATASITASTMLADGRLALVTQNARLLVSDDKGENFRPVKVARPTLFSGVAESTPGTVVLVGLNGVQQVPLK
jgi:photosystem II stability/assembly factor-like uncharacterized protein